MSTNRPSDPGETLKEIQSAPSPDPMQAGVSDLPGNISGSHPDAAANLAAAADARSSASSGGAATTTAPAPNGKGEGGGEGAEPAGKGEKGEKPEAPEAIETPEEAEAAEASHKRDLWLARLGMFISALLVTAGVILLPIGIYSLWTQLPAESVTQVYDIHSGKMVDTIPERVTGPDKSYFDVAVSNISERDLTATVVVTGNRSCEPPCASVNLIFYSIPSERGGHGGVSPSFNVEVPEEPGPFTISVDIPVTGQPQNYPWDNYQLVLGVGVVAKDPNGKDISQADAHEIAQNLPSVTLQNWMADFRLGYVNEPSKEEVSNLDFAYPLQWVFDMRFERPVYLKIITALLLGLITASSLFVLFVRNTRDTLIGISSLVMGLWSVRSVIVKGDLPSITVVDLVIAMVMALFLTMTWVRVTMHFRDKAKGTGEGGW